MSENMRLVVVASEFPYPPNHGGRADIWRRLLMLKRLGCEVMLICWYDDQPDTRPTTECFERVRSEVSVLKVLPNQRGFKRNALRFVQMLRGVPSHVAARAVYGREQKELIKLVNSFDPNAILLDSLYGGLLALSLHKKLQVPLFYRSHNIEHRYFFGQAKAATRWRNRLAWSLACLNLQRFETLIMQSARVCFDISADDLAWWASKGIAAAQWLPPLSEATLSPPLPSINSPIRELAFLGNLNTPNNVQGIHWLVEEVMPIVWALRPSTILHVAGSRPIDSIRRLFSQSERLCLYENVPDVMGFLLDSAVLVNPVLSGSGVNVKTLDMLMTPRPIVCTPQGVAGLVTELKELCVVADDASAFAQCLVEQLDKPQVEIEKRNAAHVLFGPETIRSMLERIGHEIELIGNA